MNENIRWIAYCYDNSNKLIAAVVLETKEALRLFKIRSNYGNIIMEMI